MPILLVTGSSGLIGSEVVSHFGSRGWTVYGVDNNMRADFFGPQGDIRWNPTNGRLSSILYAARIGTSSKR
jgi:CDP-paratose 2-epimerase